MYYSQSEADDLETIERMKTYIYRRRLIKLAKEDGFALFAKLKMQKMIECEGYVPSSFDEFEPIAMAAWAQIGKKDRVYYAFIQNDMLPPVKTLYGRVCKKPRLQTILEETVKESDIVKDTSCEKREELKMLLMEFQTTLTRRDILLALELNRFMKTL